MKSLSRSLPGSLGVALCLASTLPAQHVTAPMLPYKDGDVSLKSAEGGDEELVVTGEGHDYKHAHKANVAWLTFQSQVVDLAHASAANLSLNLGNLKKGGTLRVYALTAPIGKAEDKVTWADLRFDIGKPVASMRLDESMVNMIVNLDVTSAIKTGPFHGLALVSDGTLQAAFSSRESGMPPMIQLRYPALTGPQGPMGPKGEDGMDGKDGLDGKDGQDGIAGPAGPVGPMGPVGPTGPQGIQGETGATGAVGPIGPQGIQGEMGPMGPQGIAGETGPAGPMGPQGPQGEAGPMGPIGLTGPQGERGPEGPAGPPGKDGATSWIEKSDTISTHLAVGIGTTQPQSKLHVVGDAMVTGVLRGASFGFGGMYTRDDCGTNTINNPLTGGLTCPAGFTAYRIGRFRAAETNCGANQFICIK